MNNYKSFFAVAATAIGFLAVPSAANAFTLGGIINGEGAFSELDATIGVAAEGRIGDLSGAAEHEFNIHYDNENGGQTVPTQYRSFDWVSGEGVDFSLTFANNLLTYIIGGQTLEYSIADSFKDLFIRTTARKTNNSVVVDNLFLNGTAIAENSSFTCTDVSGCDYFNSSQYLWLTDLDETFTLTGTTTMFWTGDAKNLSDKTAPHRSQLAFQLKLGNVAVEDELAKVPEPVSMSLLSVGLVGLAMKGLRRQQKG
ncbi:MAG: choice-of-anchor W domain-containing protein [Lyngbya sp.]|nr:choice-of-anchor W domain-containing protein [Lyngbya sp.]